MSVLQAEFLAKSYKSRKVVSDVSLTVNSNEIVGLLGPNGAGKTTTFYMVVGLVRHDQGKITIDGDDISVLPMHERARRGIGYLPQEASIFRRLTVYENLMAVTDIKKIITDLRNRGLGVLITDHNVRETLDVCERAYIVGEGKIIATGTPEEVMNDEHVKRVYLGEQFKL